MSVISEAPFRNNISHSRYLWTFSFASNKRKFKSKIGSKEPEIRQNLVKQEVNDMVKGVNRSQKAHGPSARSAKRQKFEGAGLVATDRMFHPTTSSAFSLKNRVTIGANTSQSKKMQGAFKKIVK
ncbi:MAG TPA: hypothetical protein VLE96_06325 [Chlamydiales bacterium]|nr:hypothetical protein [Chlamydiales bacterium]